MHESQQMLQIALRENQIVLAETAQQKLLAYLELLKKWNKVFNLTSISNMHDVIYLHLIDSLSCLPFLSGQRCLDVGSGGGLPGIPLAIADINRQWTLIDKNNKKTRFLTQVIAELQLTNVHVVHRRCEDFHTADCFDSIISRAFGTINLFVETTQHLCCPNGKWIAMKGKLPQVELNALSHAFTATVMPIAIKGSNVARHVIGITRKN